MPNWCDNTATIYGTKEVLEAIVEKAKIQEEAFSMEQFMTVPEFPEKDKVLTGSKLESESFKNALIGNTNYAYDNWYDWCIGNWGTKWDMSESYVSAIVQDGDRFKVMLSYSTAWSPNNTFWTTFSELYPVEITHRYYEEGMMFIGEATYLDGRVNDLCLDVTEEMLLTIGAVANDEGGVDWETDQDYDLYDLFPLSEMNLTKTT